MSTHDRWQPAAWLAGQPNTDLPGSVCPTIAAFISEWRDKLSGIERDQLLAPFLPRIVGTKESPSLAEARGYLALDWLVRVLAPAVLDMTPRLRTQATALRALDALCEMTTVLAAQSALTQARAACGDIWDKAQAPALAKARAAVRAAETAGKRAAKAARARWGEEAAKAVEKAEDAREKAAEAAAAAERAEDDDWDNANELVGAVWAASCACDAAWAEANDAGSLTAEARDEVTHNAHEAVWDAALSAVVSINVSLLESEIAALDLRACELLDSMIALSDADLPE